MKVQVNPKGSRQHDHRITAKINNCERDQLERLLGAQHTAGDGQKISAEWFLVTDHGSATIHDYWAFNEGEYAICTANERAATLIVDYFKRNGIQAYRLTGEL